MTHAAWSMSHVYLCFDSCMLKDSVMKNIQNLFSNGTRPKGDTIQQLLDLKEWSQNPERYERRLNFRGAGLVQPGPGRSGYAGVKGMKDEKPRKINWQTSLENRRLGGALRSTGSHRGVTMWCGHMRFRETEPDKICRCWE